MLNWIELDPPVFLDRDFSQCLFFSGLSHFPYQKTTRGNTMFSQHIIIIINLICVFMFEIRALGQSGSL